MVKWRATMKRTGRLTWLLRHGAAERGLAMDGAGWVAVDDVLRELGVTRGELGAVVLRDAKRRFEIAGGRVRASQGHSFGVPVVLDQLEASWSAYDGSGPLWHGTRAEVIKRIRAEGIRPVARTHVHMATSRMSPVGKRARVDVLIEVSAGRLREIGQRIYTSPNGVALVREVPPSCIVEIHELGRGQNGFGP
jgi:putative RNA 2'-phosphotransferase